MFAEANDPAKGKKLMENSSDNLKNCLWTDEWECGYL